MKSLLFFFGELMAQIIQVINNRAALEYTFNLQRHTGKNQTLAKGNQMLNSNDRMHFIVKSQISSYLRELATTTVISTHPVFNTLNPMFHTKNPCIILVTVYSPTKRRMDAPNVYPTVKALIDGMTDAGVWSDDNNNIIKLTAFKHGGLSHNKNYQIKLTISPYQEITDDTKNITI